MTGGRSSYIIFRKMAQTNRKTIKSLLLVIMLYGIVTLSVTGCAFFRPKAQTGKSAPIAPLPRYSGPKASIAVAGFDVQALSVSRESGLGLRQMLIAALTKSNRFLIIENHKAADLILTTVLTQFEPQASGGRAGLGGGGGINNGILGGLLGANVNKAHIGLDIRVVDVSSSKVVAATHLQGQASDNTANVNGVFGGRGLEAELAVYANTAMEKAIRICIAEAVSYIYKTTPESYYKH